MKPKALKVGSLCRCKKDLWQNARQVVRIAKRKGARRFWFHSYFVVGLDHPAGYGTWVEGRDLIPLTPLELLALQAEE